MSLSFIPSSMAADPTDISGNSPSSSDSLKHFGRKMVKNWRLWVTLLLVCATTVLGWQLWQFYQQAFYPHTIINGISVGDRKLSEAIEILKQANPHPPNFTIEVRHGETVISSSSTQLAAHYNYDQAIPTIFTTAHQGTWLQQLQKALGISHEFYDVETTVSPLAIEELLSTVAAQTNQTGVQPQVSLTKSGDASSIVVTPGEMGEQLDTVTTRQAILTQIRMLPSNPPSSASPSPATTTPLILSIAAVMQTTRPPLTTEEITTTEQTAKKLVGKHLKLKVQNYHFDWDDKHLISLLSPPNKLDTAVINQKLTELNHSLPSQPINAEFNYNPETLEVTHFSPGKDGLTINQSESSQHIIQALETWLKPNSESSESAKLSQEIILPAAVQPPEISLDKTNNLGLKKLIGFGESFYAHSIPGRVKNVALTAQRINLTLVKPGEEFSFNKTLGEVSAATGFSPAYVIRGGKTELGDGGGVCQVSSTLFRAAMNAGLDITKRLPHSYRVSYYELNSQAGFDATVYAGNVDFRFVNDTPGYLLIATETDSNKLWMKVEIYGSSDGRTATISDYKSWGATGPLPTQYIPTDTLPHGKKQQIDWPAAGLKTSFVYTVKTADGTLKQQETYTSNYHPWAAKYLVGI